MRFERLRVVAMAPLAAGVLLASCGGADDGSSGTPEDTRSLQERLFSSGGIDFAKQEQLVRECMTAQGFEYTPRDMRETVNTVRIDPNSEDFVRDRGFGISTMFANEIEVTSMDEDPNLKYRNSLDATQQAAYDKALYGDLSTGGTFGGGGAVISIGGSASSSNDGGGPVAQPMAIGGCMGKALEESGANQVAFDAELFDQLQDLEKRIKSDPEMVAAMGKWSKCMADSGYQYRDRDQAMNEIREEFGDLIGLEMVGDGGMVFSVAGVAVSNGGGEVFDPFADVDKSKLAELQAKEKRIALASFECSQEHLGEVEAEVRERVERAFLEENPELKERAGS